MWLVNKMHFNHRKQPTRRKHPVNETYTQNYLNKEKFNQKKTDTTPQYIQFPSVTISLSPTLSPTHLLEMSSMSAAVPLTFMAYRFLAKSWNGKGKISQSVSALGLWPVLPTLWDCTFERRYIQGILYFLLWKLPVMIWKSKSLTINENSSPYFEIYLKKSITLCRVAE